MLAERLPSLKGIEAFISVADASSFRVASERLCLTTSAISRRIQLLEEQIGIQLFHRNTRTVRLTTAGQNYLDLLMPALDTIQQAGAAIGKEMPLDPVRIACSSMVASQWLTPLLASFRRNWPDVAIEIYSFGPFKPQLATTADLYVTSVNDGQECPGAIRLFGMSCFPICSAELEAEVPIRRPEDLNRVPLIDICAARDAWPIWFRAARLKHSQLRGTILIEDSGTYVDAVSQGLGVGLGSMELTGESLRLGKVKRLFDIQCPYPGSIYLGARGKALDKPVVRALHDWIVDSALSSASAMA